jgi:hypothetical protein
VPEFRSVELHGQDSVLAASRALELCELPQLQRLCLSHTPDGAAKFLVRAPAELTALTELVIEHCTITRADGDDAVDPDNYFVPFESESEALDVSADSNAEPPGSDVERQLEAFAMQHLGPRIGYLPA